MSVASIPSVGFAGESGQSAIVARPKGNADALSTAMFILGPEATRDLCRQHPEIGAVLVRPTGEGQEIEVEVVGRAEGIVQLEEPNAVDP